MEVASIDHDLGIDFNDLLSSIHQVPASGLEPGPDQTQLAENLTMPALDQSFKDILSEVDGIFGSQIEASTIVDPSFYAKHPAPSLGLSNFDYAYL